MFKQFSREQLAILGLVVVGIIVFNNFTK